jgi:hypothetical protein
LPPFIFLRVYTINHSINRTIKKAKIIEANGITIQISFK